MIGFAGYFHLILFGLILPWAAVRRARRMASAPYPPRKDLFISILLQHFIFIILTLLVAWAEGSTLFTLPEQPVKSILTTAIILVVIISVMIPFWRRNVITRERKAYLFMPRGSGEKTLWALISLTAGFGEEIVYRGVMWELLGRLTGSLWQAALIAGIAFAIGHFYQGWKTVLVIFFFALGAHLLVFQTGSLIPVMIVHFGYDLTAGLIYSYFGEKSGYPLEGVPADADQPEFQSTGVL